LQVIKSMQKCHPLSWVGAGFALPFDAVQVRCVAVVSQDALHIALPINANERDILFIESCKHVEGNAAAPMMVRGGIVSSPLKKRRFLAFVNNA
jgi:hypothetical protein